MIFIPWGRSFSLNQTHPMYFMLKVRSSRQKKEIRATPRNSTQREHIALALPVALAAHSPPNGIAILHLENKFSGLL